MRRARYSYEMETYDHICMVNRYLYGEMEKLTVLIKHYRKARVNAEYLCEKRYRLKYTIEKNLDKMFLDREREMLDEKEKENAA